MSKPLNVMDAVFDKLKQINPTFKNNFVKIAEHQKKVTLGSPMPEEVQQECKKLLAENFKIIDEYLKDCNKRNR